MSTILQRLHAWAGQRPEGIACSDDQGHITYDSLSRASDRLAATLKSIGAGSGTVVGVLLPRSTAYISAIVAVLKSEAAFMPLDLGYPSSRLKFMITDSGASIIICNRKTVDIAATLGCRRILDLDSERNAITEYSETDSHTATAAHDLCYLIYTSGTTGSPKGVIIEHRNLEHLLRAHGGIPKLSRDDRVLQFSSVSFDASIFEIFLTLDAGATLVIPKREACIGPELLDTIERLEVTAAVLPPSLLSAVTPRKIPSLRFIVAAGESLNRSVAARWESVTEVWNAYGPTEATVCALTTRFDPSDASLQVPLGLPIEGVHIYLLDERQAQVPPGQIGEICIGGNGVARGYNRNSELTRRHFIADPFSSMKGSRIYRTGDLGRWRPDGKLEFHGRHDRQVKVRGYRIELDEIEAALSSLPEVEQAAVLIRPDNEADGTAELVAYAVPGTGQSRIADIIQKAHEILPAHMVPAEVLLVDSIPLNVAGKRDLPALPKSVPAHREVSQDTGKPAGDPLAVVLAHWGRVLSRDNVALHDDFLALGGDSLRAARIISALRGDGYVITYEEFFRTPSPHGQAQILRPARSQPDVSARPFISNDLHPPLTSQQLQIWILANLNPEYSAYVAQVIARFPKSLSEAILHKALKQLVSRHDVLQMRFSQIAGLPVQERDPGAVPVLRVVNGTADDTASGRSTVHEVASADLRAHFALDRAPLARWTLCRNWDGSSALVQTEHHLIHDGWSSILLVKDLAQLYTAQALEQPAPESRFGSYAEYASSSVADPERRKRQVLEVTCSLSDAPASSSLPLTGPRPKRRSGESGLFYSHLNAAETDKIRKISSSHSVTPFTIFWAAFSLAFRDLAGMDDFVFGCAVANRRDNLDWNTAGMFVNVVPLRMQIARGTSPAEVLRTSRTVLQFAEEHSGVTCYEVVKELRPARLPSVNPLYQIILSSQDADVGDLYFGMGNPAMLEEVVGSASKTDLTVIAFPGTRGRGSGAPGVRYVWQYDSEIISEVTVAGLSRKVHSYQTAAWDD